MDRRQFLKGAALAATGTALAGCDTDLLRLLDKGEEQLWGMNVHPFSGSLVDAQIEALNQLGIRKVRITLGLHSDTAGPYLSGFDAEYIGLLNDFGDPIPDASAWTGLVRKAVERAPGLYCYEVLNEPTDLSASEYVENYLKPAYETIKAINPAYRVAAAAPTGTSAGRLDFYQMTSAGADDWCDFRAVHEYTNQPETYIKGTRRPFLVTESGKQDRNQHVNWWSDKMTHISGVLDTDRLYFYTLADSEDSQWALISKDSRAGAINVLSPLYDYIRGKYGR